MHKTATLKTQADTLKSMLAALGLTLPHQQALRVTAAMNGHASWDVAIAAETSQMTSDAARKAAIAVIAGDPEDGLYEGKVTVDMTLSTDIRVYAKSQAHAIQLMREAATVQYPHGFDIDDGNYRGSSDYYVGDEDAVTEVSKPEISTDSDYSGTATWKDKDFEYLVQLSRNEPDSSSESRRAKVTATFSLRTPFSEARCTKALEVHSDLYDYLHEEATEELMFVDIFTGLARKLKRPGRMRK